MSRISEDNKNDNDQRGDGSDEITLSKNECTSSEQNNVNNITKGIDRVDILSVMSTCACCGKNGNSSDMNTCNKCKEVKYCNAACKKKHRSKHKKACEKRVAELHDEALFKDHPHNEECPICFIPLPSDGDKVSFETCCGRRICDGCIYAIEESEGGGLCAFCRTPTPSSAEEATERTKKLAEKGNAVAICMIAGYYAEGINGMTQDIQKANELYLEGGELGYALGYFNLGMHYANGRGVEVDQKKAKYYYELAAMCGHIKARHNLGCSERQAGNLHRAIKHMIMAAKAGDEMSLNTVKHCFMQGMVKKDEYANTLRAHQQRKDEMKSDARDKAELALASDMLRSIRNRGYGG